MIYDLNNDSTYKLADNGNAVIIYNKDNHDYLYGPQIWDLTNLNEVKNRKSYQI